MFDSVVVHYGEIGLKGKNRVQFEDLLVTNINAKIKDLVKSVKRETGLIGIALQSESQEEVCEALKKTPGITYFSFAKRVSIDMDQIVSCVLKLVGDTEKNTEAGFKTFGIQAKRRNKHNALKSDEINRVVGQAVVDMYGKKVDLKNPGLLIRIEVSTDCAYVSCKNIRGVGGLPVNSKQKVVCLLSGGFDSPVAAYLMMKRGCEVTFVHFKNENAANGGHGTEQKIKDLVSVLSQFQPKSSLYIVPFEQIQKEIIMNVESDKRMLVYRRFMMRIATRIAEDIGGRFLIVGDSLSQVASQSFENLEATYHNTPMHVLSPLIGMDKEEIMNIAHTIGTFEISKQPHGDCCSYFLPDHPMLRASSKMIAELEKKFDIEKLIDDVLERVSREPFEGK